MYSELGRNVCVYEYVHIKLLFNFLTLLKFPAIFVYVNPTQLRKSIQYSVIAYMGKESDKEWTYVYVWPTHFSLHLKLNTNCKSPIRQ